MKVKRVNEHKKRRIKDVPFGVNENINQGRLGSLATLAPADGPW